MKQQYFIFQIIFAVFIIVGLVFFRPNWLSAENTLWIVIPIFVALMAWVFYFADPKRPPAPIFETAVTFYAITYAISTYTLELGFSKNGSRYEYRIYDIPFFHPIDLVDNRALYFVAIGTLLMSAGYYCVKSLLYNRLPAFAVPKIKDGYLLILIYLLLMGHISYLVVPFVRGFPSIGQFLVPAGYVAIGTFGMLWYEEKISKSHAAIVGIIFFSIVFWFRASDGALTPILLFGLFAFFLFFRWYQTIPWKLVLICGVIMMTVYPVIPAYRLLTWQGDKTLVDIIYNPTLLKKASNKDKAIPSIKELIEDGATSLTKRFGFGVLFSHIVKETPSNVPYWQGHSYKLILTSFIPRVIWPEKPEERLGYEFRERYNFIFSKKNTTTVNIPWLVEMYINFGKWGVYIGMFLNGVLIALLSSFFYHHKMRALDAVVGLAIFFPFVYQEANFSVVTGSMLTLTIAMWCYFYIGYKCLRFGSRIFRT